MSSQCLRITLNLLGLAQGLRRLPHETKWVEFKANQRDPRAIGEYVSALMNAASLHGKARAYVLWVDRGRRARHRRHDRNSVSALCAACGRWEWKKNMPLTDSEFAAILGDETKRIRGDVAWREDEDHSPAREFRVEVESAGGWPLFVQGRCSFVAGTLTYALILKTAGRIYALDLGRDHHNPQCERVGEKHKHRWSVTETGKHTLRTT